jgi:hypothetical protein
MVEQDEQVVDQVSGLTDQVLAPSGTWFSGSLDGLGSLFGNLGAHVVHTAGQ